MSAALLVVSWILATAAAPTGAPADPAPTTAAAAPEADATKDQAIAELAETAARQFDQRRFTEAEETLRRAIALSARPRLFYNLAQAYRADGNCASARDAYGDFLTRASATDSTRERAQRWFKEMRDCVDRASATKDVPPASESTPSVAAVPPPKPPTIVAAPGPAPTAPSARETIDLTARNEPLTRTAGRVRPARMVGWGLIGAGVLAEIGALLFQLDASSIQRRLDGSTPLLPSEDSGLRRQGSRDAGWALVTAVSGGVLGVAGGATLIITRDRSVTPSATAMLGWTCRF